LPGLTGYDLKRPTSLALAAIGTAIFGGGNDFFKAWGSTDARAASRLIDGPSPDDTERNGQDWPKENAETSSNAAACRSSEENGAGGTYARALSETARTDR
jgi:hypothetical protein